MSKLAALRLKRLQYQQEIYEYCKQQAEIQNSQSDVAQLLRQDSGRYNNGAREAERDRLKLAKKYDDLERLIIKIEGRIQEIGDEIDCLSYWSEGFA
ncbi:uncharacterized protein LAJ45_07239 [Morchella importuna]|nr:uncharacterized protein LAJ45_07239 [Morchella importuna]KAH8148528.1 hypothetical protein LAJ45_07239 [Morchella importuna]